jgi:hypothetical protein
MSSIPVLLSAQDLSADCSTPEKGRKVPMSKMDVELALERLRAFASLSSLQLAQVEAVITLVRGDLRLTVTNEGGRLMVHDARDAGSASVEKTPEEIISWLMSVEQAEPTRRGPVAPAGRGGGFGSLAGEGKKIALIVVMMIGIVVMGWINFGPKSAPEGIVFIDHPVRIAGLNEEFSGRYGDLGDPRQVVFIVADNELRVHLITSAGGMESEPLRVMSYRYGSRGMEEIMVAENGAIIERDGAGNLVHSGTVYPRIRS